MTVWEPGLTDRPRATLWHLQVFCSKQPLSALSWTPLGLRMGNRNEGRPQCREARSERELDDPLQTGHDASKVPSPHCEVPLTALLSQTLKLPATVLVGGLGQAEPPARRPGTPVGRPRQPRRERRAGVTTDVEKAASGLPLPHLALRTCLQQSAARGGGRAGGARSASHVACPGSSPGQGPLPEEVAAFLSLFCSPLTPLAGLEMKDFFNHLFLFFKNKSVKSVSMLFFPGDACPYRYRS